MYIVTWCGTLWPGDAYVDLLVHIVYPACEHGGLNMCFVILQIFFYLPAVSADVSPYISVAIKASFLKLGMINICKNNIAKMFLEFFKI